MGQRTGGDHNRAILGLFCQGTVQGDSGQARDTPHHIQACQGCLQNRGFDLSRGIGGAGRGLLLIHAVEGLRGQAVQELRNLRLAELGQIRAAAAVAGVNGLHGLRGGESLLRAADLADSICPASSSGGGLHGFLFPGMIRLLGGAQGFLIAADLADPVRPALLGAGGLYGLVGPAAGGLIRVVAGLGGIGIGGCVRSRGRARACGCIRSRGRAGIGRCAGIGGCSGVRGGRLVVGVLCLAVPAAAVYELMTGGMPGTEDRADLLCVAEFAGPEAVAIFCAGSADRSLIL